jgi:hypothetical protein
MRQIDVAKVQHRRSAAGAKQQVKFLAAHTDKVTSAGRIVNKNGKLGRTAWLRCFRLKLAESKFDTFARTYGEHYRRHANVAASWCQPAKTVLLALCTDCGYTVQLLHVKRKFKVDHMRLWVLTRCILPCIRRSSAQRKFCKQPRMLLTRQLSITAMCGLPWRKQ